MKRLDGDSPLVHEFESRLKLNLDSSEALPEQVQNVIQSSFLSTLSAESVAERNEKFLEAHRISVPHIHSIIRVREASKGDLASSVTLLQETLTNPDITIKQAEDGLELLQNIDAAARKAYLAAAHEHWPEATVFRQELVG